MTSQLVFGDPEIRNGILDLQNVNLNDTRVALKGDWYYFENQLISPPDILESGKSFAYFPRLWNEMRKPESGMGYATYALFIVAPKDAKSLALEIPQLYSSYSIWVNNILIASNGKVGTSKSESVPQWLPQTVTFENTYDTIKIVLQISNFDHYKGGAIGPIYLGSAELFKHSRKISIIGGIAESATLVAIFILFSTIYFFGKRKRIIMYFALLCLTWAIRVNFSNLYLFIHYVPDFDWTIMVKIEYITLFLTMIWAILFVSRLFPKEENKIVKFIIVGANILFISFTTFAEPIFFTHWLTLYLSFAVVLLVYAVFVVLWGWINQRSGANYITASVLLGVFIFTYDVFSYGGTFTYKPIIFSACYIIFFSLLAIALLMHLNIIETKQKSITKLTYKDLYK